MMLDDLADEQDIGKLAESNVELASEQARRLVAARPDDEGAAALLKKIIRSAVQHGHVKRTQGPPPLGPDVAEATQLIAAGELEKAEILLRQHLKASRNDAPAMHLMAEIAARCGFREDAERILKHSANIHFNSTEAMADLGRSLHRIAAALDLPQYVGESLAAFDRVIEIQPKHEGALAYKAGMLVHERRLEAAQTAFRDLIAAHPQVSEHWMNYGFLLKTIGEFGAAIAAYRTAIALDPCNGAAWFGLSNMKLGKFFAADIEDMTKVLVDPDLSDISRVEINFSLAKALDDAKDYERAAGYLSDANTIRAKLHPANSDLITRDVDFVSKFFTREFFVKREGWGDPRHDPIFILGMPRAGSTLVEQILSSHSAIEGTEELFILLKIGNEMTRDRPGKRPDEVLLELGRGDVARLGGRYLDLAQRFRRTKRPLFTDKNPSNWHSLALIHSILPNAAIIDIRRNPMDCCFGNYRQHFQSGANFSYGLHDLGRYYSNYVRMMRHFDEVLPGRVYRLIYDDLIDDLEGEVRRLLAHLGLPFEDNCLRYYETERPVHTPSSEQVRQPINRSGLDRWRNYEPWLGELKDALGEILVDWRR